MVAAIQKSPDVVNVDEQQQQHNNRAILQDLERQRDLATIGCYAAGVGALMGIAVFSPLITAAMPPVSIMLGRLQTIGQQVSMMRRLIDAFDEGIEIHPRLNPPGLRQIDFFLRFPDKKFLTLMIASQGDSVVSFNEKTEMLQYRRKGGGLKNWEPDPLSILSLQILWIAKERRDLKGGSSKDARKPVAKMLVLSGATKLGDHNEELYSTMAGGYRALWIRKYGTVCVVEEDQVIEAIIAYLAQDRAQ